MLFPASISCFLAVARHQNVTRAAEELYMSRQAVSKQIMRLEEELVVPLFDRNSGKLAITAAGRMYYEFFSSMFDRWKALQADVRALSEQDRLVRIGFLKGINIEEQIFSLIDECSKPRVRVFQTDVRSDIEIAWRADESNPVITGMVDKIKNKLNISE